MTKKYLPQNTLKSLLAMFIAILLVLSGLFGPQAANAASKVDISTPVKLKWLAVGSSQAEITKVQTEINKYLKGKINATLELDILDWGEYTEWVSLYMASGEPFDICFTSYWMANYEQFARWGGYTDISGMLDKYAPKTKVFLGSNILKGAEVDGKIYAIPTYNVGTVQSQGVLLNKKLVQKYKIDTSKIKKLQDLETIFKSIKAKEPKTICFSPFDRFGSAKGLEALNYDKESLDNMFGAVLRDGKSTAVVSSFDTAEAKSIFTLMNQWFKKGYIHKSSDTANFFKNNKSNIFAIYSQLTPTLAEDLMISEKVDMIPVALTKPVLTTKGIRNSMQAIPINSKNPERALMLLELVNTDEKLSNMLNFGIEGVHYKKTGAKTITQLPAGIQKYNPLLPWQFGNQSIVYSLPGYSPKSWEQYVKDSKNAVSSPLLGYEFDAESVATVLPKLEGIMNKYYKDLAMGKADPNVNLPKMNNELKKAGLPKVIAEMQKQVDQFVRSGR